MFAILLILALLVLVVWWAYLTFGVSALVVLAVIIGVTLFIMRSNDPEHRTRHIHKAAEKEVFKSSQRYTDNVRRTLRR